MHFMIVYVLSVIIRHDKFYSNDFMLNCVITEVISPRHRNSKVWFSVRFTVFVDVGMLLFYLIVSKENSKYNK